MKKLLAVAVSVVISGSAIATTLDQSVKDALMTHPDLQAARAESRAVVEDVDGAKGALRPRIDLNAGIGRERTDSENVNSGDPITLTRKELGISAIWTLFDGSDRGEVARRMGISESTAFALMDLEQQIVLQAAQAYTNLWRAEQQFTIARESREAHETLVDQIGRRVENGVSNEAELVQAQGRLALALSNQSAATANLQSARATYHRVVGSIPEQNIVAPMMDWSRPASLDSAVDVAFNNHPVIAEAEADIREAMGQAKSSDGTLLPRVNLELSASRNEDLDGIENVAKDRMAMLRLNWTLYNGTNSASKRASAERVTQAENLLNDAQREVIEATHQAWNEYQSTSQQMNFLDTYVQSAENSRNAYQQQFTINRRSLLEVLDAEVELFDARSSMVDAQADNVIADHQLAASQGQLLAALGLVSN